MDEQQMKPVMGEFIPDQNRFYAFLERLFEAARPSAVFSQPVTQGEYSVITASEVIIGLGAGYGGGGGGNSEHGEGSGGGGGGGGSATARPVAAISIGPKGIHVEPVVDATKIAVTMFTVIGTIFMTRAKMRRMAKTGRLEG